jgi:dUTP pyrophosphatase
MRKFEIAKGWEEKEISLPARQTKFAAGYDIEAAETVEVPSIWFTAFKQLGRFINSGWIQFNSFNAFKPVLVPTGIKVRMEEDEVLFLYNRSSNPLKRGLLFSNSVAVIDADYYGNEDNDGAIYFQFINIFPWTTTIKKGDRIGQGVFQKYLLVDDDKGPIQLRKGGHGSTGKS